MACRIAAAVERADVRLLARSYPDTTDCPDCDGQGHRMEIDEDDPDSEPGRVECARCEGLGEIEPEEDDGPDGPQDHWEPPGDCWEPW